MRDNGEELKAIYHSHPEAPAQPSLADIRQLTANTPDVLYLIVPSALKGVLDLRGFSHPVTEKLRTWKSVSEMRNLGASMESTGYNESGNCCAPWKTAIT